VERRGGSVMIGVDEAKSVSEQLAERRVFVDWRPGAGLRISPHFFNTDEEVSEALEILAGLLA
jgi:kynureninase